MRIGKTMIDTDNMSIEELKILEHELHQIRRRKEQAESFVNRMNELIAEAKQEGFSFINCNCGFVQEENDFVLYDERV